LLLLCYKTTSLERVWIVGHKLLLGLSVGHPDHHLLAALLSAPTATLRLRLSVPPVLGRPKLVKTGLSPGSVGRLRGVGLGKMGSGPILGELGEHILPTCRLVASRGRSLSSLLTTRALAKEGFSCPGWGKHLLELTLPKKCSGQVEKESPVRTRGGRRVCSSRGVIFVGGCHGGAPVHVGGTPI